ncbi:DEAD/DEAH box helicase [Krasilnikovia cinnamomea]|nr:DEAD/DEAH box helicase [Krasilnikovia cinnamomea]
MGLDLLLGQLCTTDTVVRGRQFELVVRFWLRADPSYGPTVAKMWRWEDWPGAGGQRDTGVDLVVQTTDGQLWAVQCKGHAVTTPVTKAHLDSFLARSDDRRFSRRLLVASTDLLSGNARDEVDRERDIPLTVVGLAELQAAKVTWPARIDDLLVADPQGSLRAARRELRQHQKQAVADVVAELDRQKAAGVKDARTTLVMACGSGKTLTCHGVHEEIDARRTLVLAPSLSLLAQLVREWAAQSAEAGGLRIAVVCSDATVAGDDLPKVSSSELPVPVTTDPDTLRTFLTDHVRDELPVVVFSTYQSSPVVAAAQKAADVAGTPVPFDLVVADEAHYLAGRPAEAFATVLHDDRVHAVRRVFATATPRVVSANVKARAADLDDRVVCMDDPALFGPVAHRLTFGRAIELGLLADYQVLVLGVEQTDDGAAAAVAERHLVQVGDDTTDAASFAALTALGTAWREHNVRTAISFHSRVERARQFAQLVTATAGQPLLQLPASVQASHVSGAMPTGKRAHLLRELTAGSEDDRLRLLANARCLTAGVDVPSLDAVVFVDPRRSATDVVQAVGRALRVADEKERGLIILPVVLRPRQDPDEALSTSAFDTVWQVLGALREHDETLAEELDSLRTALGAGRGVPRGALGKIVIDMPIWRGEDLAARLRARIIERTTSGFFHGLGKLRAFVAEKGHARVPTSWVTDDGFPLGTWAGNRRSQYRRGGELSADRVALLEALPGWVWHAHEDGFVEGLEKLRAYATEHGNTRVAKSWVTDDGFPLGTWAGSRRSDHRRGQLSPDRIAQLEALPGWVWDTKEDGFAEGLEKLRAYATEHRHARVPAKFTTADGFQLGTWVSNRRRRRGQLSPDQVAQLEALPGWVWDTKEDGFAEGLEKLRAYADEHGHARVPKTFVTDDGFPLGGWVSKRRSFHRDGKLSADREEQLEAVPGWVWDKYEADFAEGLEKLRAYADEHRHARVPAVFVTDDGFPLGGWVRKRRNFHRDGKLSADREEQLEAVPGWVWDAREASFAEGLEKLRAYADEHRHARVPAVFVTDDGFPLGGWVRERRGQRGRLSADRVAQLEKVPGWVWDARR